MDDVILLHGALGASAQLDPLANALRLSFCVHQVEFEGHANTLPRERPYRIEHFAENVAEYMAHTGLDTASVFGYSMGGYVALHLAHALPARVRNVATLGTKFRWDPATAERETKKLDAATIRAKVPKFADVLERRHAKAGGWERVLAETAGLLRSLGDNQLLADDVLAHIRHPVRVLVGDKDNTVTVEEATDVSRHLAAGTITVLSDTPHPIEQVDVSRLALLLTEVFGAR
jgi:pimeloyl-ACP methyl ester carboxylesterase